MTTDPALLDSLRSRTRAHQSASPTLWPARPLPSAPDLSETRFEFSSQGDRVPGRLLLPTSGSGPWPLVLLQHGAGGDKNSPYLDVAHRWVHAGVAVASIDFPLHGQRRSEKLSDRLLTHIGRGAPVTTDAGGRTDTSTRLVEGFAVQAVADLRATLDALGEHPEIDEKRCAYAAFSLGSMIGTLFMAVDERPRAAALALGGGGFGPSLFDPVHYAGAISPRPLLMVNARNDTVVPPAAGEALFAAAGEPRSIEWYDTGHDSLPGVALKRMWQHLADSLHA